MVLFTHRDISSAKGPKSGRNREPLRAPKPKSLKRPEPYNSQPETLSTLDDTGWRPIAEVRRVAATT